MKQLFLVLAILALVGLSCSFPVGKPILAGTPTAISPSATSASIAPTLSATVVRAIVYVRSQPDNTSGAVGYLEAGERVTVVKCSGSWCQIKEPSGYVWRGCLSDNPDGLKCEARP